MGNASAPALAKMALDSASPIDTSSTPLEFLRHDIKKVGSIIDPPTIRGTLEHHAINAREGISLIQGPAWFSATPNMIDRWLPYMGFSETTDVWSPVDTLTAFVLGVNLIGDAFEYGNCYVSYFELSGQAGGALILEVGVAGIAQSDLTYPSLTLSVAAADEPYIFSDTDNALTLLSTNHEMERFRLRVDYALIKRWRQQLVPSTIMPGDRVVTLDLVHPFSTDEAALHAQASAGAAGQLVATNGAFALTIDWANLKMIRRGPSVPNGKREDEEINLFSRYQARASGGNPSVKITNDATP